MPVALKERTDTATAAERPSETEAFLVQGRVLDLAGDWQRVWFSDAMDALNEWVYRAVVQDAAHAQLLARQSEVMEALSPQLLRFLAVAASGPSEQERSTDTAAESGTGLLMAAAHERLTELSQLEANWDSYGAEPLSSNAVARADELLQSLKEPLADLLGELLRPYALAPLANGGVQLEWRGSGGALEVEVSPEGDLGYLLIEGEGSERTFKEADDVASSDILHLVARVLLS